MVLSVQSFYQNAWLYTLLYTLYTIYTQSILSRRYRSQRSLVTVLSRVMTSPVHRSLLRACGCLVSVVGLRAFPRCSSSFLRLSIFLVTLALFKIGFDVWQKHGLSLVYNFRLIVLCMVSTIRSCDNVISMFGSIPRDLQVARIILHSSLFGQSSTKCSTVSVATPHSLHFS